MPEPANLISRLGIGELKTSGVSLDLTSGDDQRFRIESVHVRDLSLQTSLGSMRADSVELSNVAVGVPPWPQAGQTFGGLAALTVGKLRVDRASIELQALTPPASSGSRKGCQLDPLASLEGTLHVDIADAAWIFDANVTIPIASGRVDFNRTTVEHIGPDSSMGIGRMGIYVDAPNGRTYLYDLSASSSVPGANFEKGSGGLLPSWTGDRGTIDLQPFIECLLSGASLGGLATGIADMIARTRVSAELRLGDGIIAAERNRVQLAGRNEDKNRVELSSTPRGGGLVVRIPELRASESHVEYRGKTLSTGAASADLTFQVPIAPSNLAASLSIGELMIHDIVCKSADASSAASN